MIKKSPTNVRVKESMHNRRKKSTNVSEKNVMIEFNTCPADIEAAKIERNLNGLENSTERYSIR